MYMPKVFNRPSWDEYFIQIAHVVKKRGNCIRRKVGALIVKDKQIIATGYNGTPTGIKNCFEGGCERCMKREKGILKSGEEKGKCICICAEQNALLQAARHGTSTNNATMYITDSPCLSCCKMIINSGISKVIAENIHHDTAGLNLLKKAGIEFKILKR